MSDFIRINIITDPIIVSKKSYTYMQIFSAHGVDTYEYTHVHTRLDKRICTCLPYCVRVLDQSASLSLSLPLSLALAVSSDRTQFYLLQLTCCVILLLFNIHFMNKRNAQQTKMTRKKKTRQKSNVCCEPVVDH